MVINPTLHNVAQKCCLTSSLLRSEFLIHVAQVRGKLKKNAGGGSLNGLVLGGYFELHGCVPQKLMIWLMDQIDVPWLLNSDTQSLATIRSNATAVMSGLIRKFLKEKRFMQTGFSVIPSKGHTLMLQHEIVWLGEDENCVGESRAQQRKNNQLQAARVKI